MEVTEVLKCPRTGNKLRFDDADSVVAVEESSITYPITSGIVDFCPECRTLALEQISLITTKWEAYSTI